VRFAPDLPELVVNAEVIPTGRRGEHIDNVLLFLEDRTDAIKAEARLRETERFASLGLLPANMAHEINNPLQGLQGALERLERRGKSLAAGDAAQQDIGESVTRALEVLERMRRIIAPVLDLARPHPPQFVPTDLSAEVRKLIQFLQLDPALARVTFSLQAAAELPRIATDPSQMGQLLTNVVLNAAHAMAGEGAIQFTVRMEGEQAIIEVRDSGPGIAEGDAPHLFTPFFTTKPVGKGTGLGLYLSRSIAQRLGGWLEYVPDSGPGALFRLTLPRESSAGSATAASLMRRGTEG
jgi:signal transduction histidine kinase